MARGGYSCEHMAALLYAIEGKLYGTKAETAADVQKKAAGQAVIKSLRTGMQLKSGGYVTLKTDKRTEGSRADFYGDAG